MERYLCLVGIITLSLLSGCDTSEQSDTKFSVANTEAQIRATKKADEAKESEAKTAECRANIDAKVADYHKLMANKQYWPAVLRIRFCAQRLDDPTLTALVAEGEILSYKQNIDNPELSDFDRLRAGESFERDYPDQAKNHQRSISSLRSRVEANQADNGRTSAWLRRNSTPPIGISKREAIDQYWGYPSDISKTTTSYGTREQWIYGDRRYLYFDNEVLTAVQE